ncbi:MAG: amidohydrolase [Desulfobulbaceae bacterium]|nr:amidohydrolase [Desulfobulbaceae bacterium]
MLNEYSNLYVDLSWVAYENVVCLERKHPTDPLVPKQERIDLIKEENNRHRVMLGSDLCGHFSSNNDSFQHGKTMDGYKIY